MEKYCLKLSNFQRLFYVTFTPAEQRRLLISILQYLQNLQNFCTIPIVDCLVLIGHKCSFPRGRHRKIFSSIGLSILAIGKAQKKLWRELSKSYNGLPGRTVKSIFALFHLFNIHFMLMRMPQNIKFFNKNLHHDS